MDEDESGGSVTLNTPTIFLTTTTNQSEKTTTHINYQRAIGPIVSAQLEPSQPLYTEKPHSNPRNYGEQQKRQQKENPEKTKGKRRELKFDTTGPKKGKNKVPIFRRIIKKSQFKEPKPKPNHEEIFYDVAKMPIKKLFDLFDDEWEVPDKFQPTRFKIKVSTDTNAEWSEDHGWDANLESELWKHFGHLKFDNATVMKLLGCLSMYDDILVPGTDYVMLTKKEKVWERDVDMVYVGMKDLKTALLVTYIIGGGAVQGNFLGNLSRNASFRMQFSNPNGEFGKLRIRWETVEWYNNLHTFLKKWIKINKATTHGKLRTELLRKRFENDQKCLAINEIAFNIQQHHIPEHPDNLMNPLSKNMKDLKPSLYNRQCWEKTVAAREFNLVNDWGNLIKFFKPFRDENFH